MTDKSPWRFMVTASAWIVLGFLLLPSLIVIPIAFGDRSAIVFPPKAFGFAMFQAFFTEPGWIAATWLSVRVASWTTVLAVATGVPAAYALARGRFAGRRVLTLFLLSPMMVPTVVTALGLYVYYDAIGLLDGELRLILGHAVITIPFVLITTLTGLRQVDPAIETAATVMGASRLTMLRRVTLPLIAPSIFSGALLAFLLSFDEVVVSNFISEPDSITLPVKMFASIQFDVSAILAAISTMLSVISALVCVAVAMMQQKEMGQ